ncbi:MAG: RNA polymerase sigma factor [Acidobacteriota bacterium]
MDAVEAKQSEELDMAVIQRCISNDPDACHELYTQYNRKIFNTAYRILGEEASAEDALQETMLNVYRGISNFRGDAKISTWISRITINVCLGMLRKGKKRQFVEFDNESSRDLPVEANDFSNPLIHACREELKSHIQDTFDRMTGKQALVVRLHDLEGNTIQEISKIIRCPVGTVKSRLFYGRLEFKALFNSLGYAEFKNPVVSVN